MLPALSDNLTLESGKTKKLVLCPFVQFTFVGCVSFTVTKGYQTNTKLYAKLVTFTPSCFRRSFSASVRRLVETTGDVSTASGEGASNLSYSWTTAAT